MSTRPPLPILVFDGDCGFCTTSARFLARWVVDERCVRVIAWQRLDLAELGLSPVRCQEAVQWVSRDSSLASGHRAIAAALANGHPLWRPVGALLVAPGLSWLAQRLYYWISRHRYALPGGTPACRTDRPDTPG